MKVITSTTLFLNFSDITIFCLEELNESTSIYGDVTFENCINIVFNGSNCGTNFTFRPQMIIQEGSSFIFDSISFGSTSQMLVTDSYVELLNCNITGVTYHSYFINSSNSTFLVESLIDEDPAYAQNFFFDALDKSGASLTMNGCKGKFYLTVDRIPTNLINCTPVGFSIRNINLTFNTTEFEPQYLTLRNSSIEISNLTLSSLWIWENSSITGDVLNVNTSLVFHGYPLNSQIIDSSLIFTGTNFTTDETQIKIQKDCFILSSNCSFETSGLSLILNNSNLEINQNLTIKRLDFIGVTSLNGLGTLQITNNLFFNETGVKIINSSLQISNLGNSDTYSEFDNYIKLYNNFSINTYLNLVHLPNISLENFNANLELYSNQPNTNYTIPIISINGGSISANNSILLFVENRTRFDSNFSSINYINISSPFTTFNGIGSLYFQNSSLNSPITNSEDGSNYQIYGNGIFSIQQLNVGGNLSISSVLEGESIQINENGNLVLSYLNTSIFNNTSIILNGFLKIENSELADPFVILNYNSENEYPLTLNQVNLTFFNIQTDLPPLKIRSSNITGFNSYLHNVLIEGTNYFSNSDIIMEDGKIQAKENIQSTLNLNSSNIFFGSYSGLDLNSNSNLTIFSINHTFLDFTNNQGQDNLNFSVIYGSTLELQNVDLEINGDVISDLSGGISLYGSILRIYNYYYGSIGRLEIHDSSAEAHLETDIFLNYLNLIKGKLNFTKITTNFSYSKLIFGDGTPESFVNENRTGQSLISSSGIVEINGGAIFNNIKFDIKNTSNLIIKTYSLTNIDYLSEIVNEGNMIINPNYSTLSNENKEEEEKFFVGSPTQVYFNFSVDNRGNINVNSPLVTFFDQEVSSSGIIEVYNNVTFQKGLNLSKSAKIKGMGGFQQQINIAADLNIYDEVQIDFVHIIVSGQINFFDSEYFITISNSTLEGNSFNTENGTKISFFDSVFQIPPIFVTLEYDNSDSLIHDTAFIEFNNQGVFLIESSIFSLGSINYYNYGNFSAYDSQIILHSLYSHEHFELNNSTLNVAAASILDNTNVKNNISAITYLTNSTINSNIDANLTFNGNFIIQEGIVLSGNFELILEIDGQVWFDLLPESEGSPRYYPYNAIYLPSFYPFNVEKLQSQDEQYIEFSQDGNWIKAKVKGCPKGQYSRGFDQKCIDCANGTYNNEYGAFSCIPCKPGYVANDTAQAECTPCGLGYYQSAQEQTECFECLPGTFSSKNGSANCEECSPGQYNTDNRSTGCQLCGTGNFSDNPTKCEYCPKGTFNPQEGSATCYPCFSGTYNDLLGQRFCIACGRDTYQDEMGQEICKSCPANSETNVYGASDIDDCLCSVGYYGIASEVCKLCPKGTVCNDVGILFPSAEEGFWHSDSDPATFLECSVKEACPGGGTDKCNSELGYSGNLCAACLKGFYKFGEQCMKCPNNQKNRLILVGFLIVFLCLFLFIIARKIKNYFASFSIMFSFLQVLAVISGLKLNWPSSIESTWRSISIFNFNIDFLAVECSLPLTYTQKWILCMVFPFILFFVLLFVYFLVFIHSKIVEKCGAGFMRKFPRFCSKPNSKLVNFFTHGFGKEQRKSLHNNLINSYTTILSFVYLFLSYKVLQIFDCKKQSEGTYTFGGDPALFCYDKWWKDILPWAILFLVLYVFGIPFILMILFFVSSKKLDEETFDLRFGLLCARYTKEWFFLGNIFIQPVICVIVLLFALVLQIHAKPFISDRHNTLEFVLICFSEIILFSGMVFVSNDLEETSAKGILATVIVVLIWVSFSTLIIMILFEIRHRVRVHKGKDVDEVQKSIEIASGQTILKFLASKPSFFLIWDWILESSDHKNKSHREFFQQIKDYYNSKETEKQKLKIDQFWKTILPKWKDSFYLIIKAWFIQASLQEKIQFTNLLTKIRFEGLLYLNSNTNFTPKDIKKSKRLTNKFFKQNLSLNQSKKTN
ncbi:g protein-coupled receptor-related [Anaeramoeba ignava]|uniref:G protein-coupled receptor-related n=1 Tax=Anaeramoeba ignava TaxID=1746090 RepID=A0A9Q0LV59_ANAIG|nr:g protein-coupled receptor-related [Anaeramoeba ignava]